MGHINAVKTTGKDEWYTPLSGVEIIRPYIPPWWKVWCPFDTAQSNFVKVFTEQGNTVIKGHLSEGMDYFNYCPEYDALVSNPPFSRINDVLERAYLLNKPFALLASIMAIFDGQKRFQLLKAYDDIQILIPERRIKFMEDYEGNGRTSPAFKAVYICRGILPKQICFE